MRLSPSSTRPKFRAAEMEATMTTSSFTQRIRQWLWQEPSQRGGTPRAGDVYRAYAFPGPGGTADVVLPVLMERRQTYHPPESYAPTPQRKGERRPRPSGASYEVGLRVAQS
jgi:hypothetical protein